MKNTLIVLLGPTGVGKTDLSIQLAKTLDTPIISCDSRQIFQEMSIGTAAPTLKELSQTKHYFIGTHRPTDYFSASEFEHDVLHLLDSEIFPNTPNALMVGGSMMYIDAVCKGIDEIPTIDENLRNDLARKYQTEGIDNIRLQLKMLDPEYYAEVDLKNHKRVIHALEICLMAGVPYSTLRKKTAKTRAFNIVKIGLNRDREELYNRINLRVDKMMEDGLEEEARNLYHLKHLNSLNTVGYKELFKFFDGEWTKEFAISMIKQDSRRYARKQLSWFRRDESIHWFHPNDENIVGNILSLIPK